MNNPNIIINLNIKSIEEKVKKIIKEDSGFEIIINLGLEENDLTKELNNLSIIFNGYKNEEAVLSGYVDIFMRENERIETIHITEKDFSKKIEERINLLLNLYLPFKHKLIINNKIKKLLKINYEL